MIHIASTEQFKQYQKQFTAPKKPVVSPWSSLAWFGKILATFLF